MSTFYFCTKFKRTTDYRIIRGKPAVRGVGNDKIMNLFDITIHGSRSASFSLPVVRTRFAGNETTDETSPDPMRVYIRPLLNRSV